MNVTNREKQLYDDYSIYSIKDITGEAVMTSYTVFPGIELIYNDVHMQQVSLDVNSPQNIFEINHCKEGRIECETKKGEYLYLGKGDLSISSKGILNTSSYFPLSHYHGITVSIDLDKTPQCLSCILEDVTVDLPALKEKLCKNSFLVIRENESFEHIFSELYAVPERIRKGYYKVKVLELLLFLSSLDEEELQPNKKYYTKKQVDTIKEVKNQLTTNLSDKITIKQLSIQYGMPTTTMKLIFKEVYGDSIYSFAKKFKMQKAVELLRETQWEINEIAGNLGYDNASKFAEAFRKVIGVNPSEYRKNV